MAVPFKKTLYTLLVVALLCGVGWYVYIQSESLIQGPQITIDNPADGSSFSERSIEVTGSAHNISHISINDRPIFVDNTGQFVETLLLLPGYNIIEITAQDRFEREIQKRLHLTLTEQS